MCGITAISRVDGISSIRDPRHFLKMAALAIEPRGTDATGFAWVESDNKGWYWKDPVKAREAIGRVKLPVNIDTAIAHTRMATQGDKRDNVNNHPVIDDGLMLVHNGIIHNDWSLFNEHFGSDYKPKAKVDSQVIASLLAHREMLGFTHPAEALELLRGSAAVAWLETDSKELHLARCAERPMTLGWTRKGDLVMSSAPETLKALSNFANIKFRRIREVEEGTYLRVLHGEIVEELAFQPRPKVYVSNYQSPYSQHTSTVYRNGKPVTQTVQTPVGVPLVAGPAIEKSESTKEFWKRIEAREADLAKLEEEWGPFEYREAGGAIVSLASRRDAASADDDVDDYLDDEVEVIYTDDEPDEDTYIRQLIVQSAGQNWGWHEWRPDEFWEGYELHYEYRCDTAHLLGERQPHEADVFREWCDIWDEATDTNNQLVVIGASVKEDETQ